MLVEAYELLFPVVPRLDLEARDEKLKIGACKYESMYSRLGQQVSELQFLLKDGFLQQHKDIQSMAETAHPVGEKVIMCDTYIFPLTATFKTNCSFCAIRAIALVWVTSCRTNAHRSRLVQQNQGQG